MRKFLTSAMAAVLAAGAVLATAGPASAERYRHRYHHDNDDEVAAAIIGGVAGLALGAALSSGSRSRSGYYSQGYAPNGYSYDPRYERYSGGYYEPSPYRYRERPYRTCITRDRVWDPYIGRHVTVERRYAC